MKNMVILDTTFLALNERTMGGWVLGTKAAKRLVKDFNEHLEERCAVTLESEGDCVELENVCGKIRKPGLRIQGNKIVGEVEVLTDTVKGKIVDVITNGGLPLYGDIAIEAIWPDGEMQKGKSPAGVDYKSFHFCILTGNPGTTSKKDCPVKRYDIPVLENAEVDNNGNLILHKEENKYFGVGSVLKVIGNVPTKGKIGQVITYNNVAGNQAFYELVDEDGANFFVTGTENLEKYEGFFERKDKYGDNPLAEPEKVDEVRAIDELPREVQEEILPPEEASENEDPEVPEVPELGIDEQEPRTPLGQEVIKVQAGPSLKNYEYPKDYKPELKTDFPSTHEIFKERIKKIEENKINEQDYKEKKINYYKKQKEINDNKVRCGDEVFIVNESSGRFIGRKGKLVGYKEVLKNNTMGHTLGNVQVLYSVIPDFETNPVDVLEITSYKNKQIGDIAFDEYEMAEFQNYIIKGGDAVIISTHSYRSEYNNQVCTFIKEIFPDKDGEVDLSEYGDYIDLANNNDRSFLVRLSSGRFAIVPAIFKVDKDEDTLYIDECLRGDEVTAYVSLDNPNEGKRAILLSHALINGDRAGYVLRTIDEMSQNFWANYIKK